MSAEPEQREGRAAGLLAPSLAWIAVFFLGPLAVMVA
jgi:hypothetical protein